MADFGCALSWSNTAVVMILAKSSCSHCPQLYVEVVSAHNFSQPWLSTC
jgi:hypothetical protein